MSVECIRCGAIMEFDGDDAYVCPDCGIIATTDEDGGIFFDDDELRYGELYGEQKQCPNCGTFMICVEDGWECPECDNFIRE